MEQPHRVEEFESDQDNHHRSTAPPSFRIQPAIWATGGYQPFSPLNNRPAAFPTGNHHRPNSAARDRLPNLGHQIDTGLESEFSRLNLGCPSPAYGGGGSSSSGNLNHLFLLPSQLRDLQQMMMNYNYVQPQLNPNFEGFDPSYLNDYGLNGVSRYNMIKYLNRYQPQSLPNAYDSSCGSFLNSSRNNFHCFPTRSSPRVQTQTNNNFAACDRRNPRWNFTCMQELRGNIFLVAKDQYGCRFLQRKLKEGNPQDVHMIFIELKDHICELMVIQFGNYLIQDFLAACNQQQITHLLLKVISDVNRFEDICVDPHGTRSVQKLLEFLTTPEQRSIAISVLRRITLPLTKSMDGHHIIMFCLKNFSAEDDKHILNEVADNCMEIALDRSGCCVLQQCVENATGEPKDRLIAEITSNSLRLSDDQYGNYVVQYILGLGIPRATADIIEHLSGHMVSLSMSKYGSNVVEKFLKEPPLAPFVDPIVEEIVYDPNALAVLKDPFGNFVAQSAFGASRGAVRNAMIKLIQDNYHNLHSHPHGKRVLSCFKETRGTRA